jgi:hypothetical protein
MLSERNRSRMSMYFAARGAVAFNTISESIGLIFMKTHQSEGAAPSETGGRGAHYRWPGWLARIADAELTRSMSRKGCSPDNAACEGFFGRLKSEWFYPGNWQSTTVEQFTQALDSYIRWYNEKRIKMSLSARSPLDYRRSLGLMA